MEIDKIALEAAQTTFDKNRMAPTKIALERAIEAYLIYTDSAIKYGNESIKEMHKAMQPKQQRAKGDSP